MPELEPITETEEEALRSLCDLLGQYSGAGTGSHGEALVECDCVSASENAVDLLVREGYLRHVKGVLYAFTSKAYPWGPKTGGG